MRLRLACALAVLSASLVLAGSACSSFERAKGPIRPQVVELAYYGHSMVLVANSVHTVVVNPLQAHTGFPVPDVSADLVLVSRRRLGNDNVAAVSGQPKVFAEPGVFVLGTLNVNGIPSRASASETQSPNVIFSWSMERMNFAHLGDLASSRLTTEQVALLSGLDFVFCPVGGGVTIDASAAAAVVAQISPRVVIPVRYKTGPSTLEIDGVDPFVARMRKVRRVPSTVRVRRDRLPKTPEVWVMDWRHDASG